MTNRHLKGIVLTEIPNPQKIWWEKHLQPILDEDSFVIDFDRVPDANVSLLSGSTLYILWDLTYKYLFKVIDYDFIITFQANLVTTWIGILKLIIKRKNQKHVVLQFHRKEKDHTALSRFKYRLLQLSLQSASKIICSSKGEVAYYSKVLSLSEEKFKFIPLCVDPNLLRFNDSGNKVEGEYILSAGKTLRDYSTLIKATESLKINLIIISDKSSIQNIVLPGNVKLLLDLPYWQLIRLILKAKIVVIPLQDRLISTGQSVALTAMALGKVVIITKTSGTIDYIIDGITGLFVEPYNHILLGKKIEEIYRDENRIKKIGNKAQEFVKSNFLIQKYIETLRVELTQLYDSNNRYRN